MELLVEKSTLSGTVEIPGSKSHTIRCVALASLAKGMSTISAPLVSKDTLAAVQCYQSMGAEISCGKTWRITGTEGLLHVPHKSIDVGNSGTTLRFATGSAALLKQGAAVLDGDNQIRSRPMTALLTSLNDLGAHCTSELGNGSAPVSVKGRLRGGKTSIDAITSQFLSALLMNTPLADGDSTIYVTKLNEQPYVELTLAYLDELGIQYRNDDMRLFTIPGKQSYPCFDKRVPADFSSATFFLCAGAILEADLALEGLDFSDPQGDKIVVDILKAMGANIKCKNGTLLVKGGDLQGMEIDMNDTPDALPALAVVGCFARGRTHLRNVEQARLKETDRIAVMTKELRKMGAKVTEERDGMTIESSRLQGGYLEGHYDHRVVMALSLAAMALEHPSRISTAEAIEITFPQYVNLMSRVGANIQLVRDPA